MSNQIRTIVCQHCGIGFTLTDNYLEWLGRRGAKVVVPVLCTTCFMKIGPLPKQQGEVKWFNPHKNYGFIIAEEEEKVFFHQRQIVERDGEGAHEGQEARFHVHYSAKGPEALNVELGKE